MWTTIIGGEYSLEFLNRKFELSFFQIALSDIVLGGTRKNMIGIFVNKLRESHDGFRVFHRLEGNHGFSESLDRLVISETRFRVVERDLDIRGNSKIIAGRRDHRCWR